MKRKMAKIFLLSPADDFLYPRSLQLTGPLTLHIPAGSTDPNRLYLHLLPEILYLHPENI